MSKRKGRLVFLLVILLSSGMARADGLTAEFRAFLAARTADRTEDVRDSAGGYAFALRNGRLSVRDADGAAVWRSENDWYVDSFSLADVNRDGVMDFTFVVWKSYSFGAEHPARMANDNAAVRCHLFVYSIKDSKVKALWCSSNLPRPIYSFSLHADGRRTPTQPGVRLITREGSYTGDYGETAFGEYEYEWNGWGFSEKTR